MNTFTGMALYTKEEIGLALNNREVLYDKYATIYRNTITTTKGVDTSYKRWGFLWKVKRTAHDDMREACDFLFGAYSYNHEWLEDKGFITKVQSNNISNHLYCLKKEYKDIKNLFNGGVGCYLNPEQAKFVNYYKNTNTNSGE